MKNTYKIFTLISSVLFVFSCSDLEEDRSGILSLENLQTEEDLVAALVPVYKRLQYSYRNPHFMRTNTFGSYQAKIRLGGWVTSIWGCGYGADNSGQATGAQLLGFGLLDNQWGSFIYNAKSFGYRDAHDYNTAGHPGQLESFGLLFVR